MTTSGSTLKQVLSELAFAADAETLTFCKAYI